MLKEPPLFRPKYSVDHKGLHIALPDGKVDTIPRRRLQLKPGEIISDVKISVTQQVNNLDHVYYAIHDLRVCYELQPLDEIWIQNMLIHLHGARRLEKLVAKSGWQKHRSRARSSGNSLAMPRYSTV